MINLKPIPKDYLKNKDIENYTILPYIKFPIKIFGDNWKTYPYWRVNDSFDIIYVPECELSLVHKMDIENLKYFPLITEDLDKEDININLKGWEFRYKSSDVITYLNTKKSHPNAIRVGEFCIREDTKPVFWLSGYSDIKELTIKEIIKKLGLEDKFRDGTYEITYNGTVWKEVDILFDFTYFLDVLIGYEDLKDINITSEVTLPIREFIKGLFLTKRDTEYIPNYVRKIYEYIKEK